MKMLFLVFGFTLSLNALALADTEEPTVSAAAHITWGSFKAEYVVLDQAKSWNEASQLCDAYAPGHAWQLPTKSELQGILTAGKDPFMVLHLPDVHRNILVSWINDDGANTDDRVLTMRASGGSTNITTLQSIKASVEDEDLQEGVPAVCLKVSAK